MQAQSSGFSHGEINNFPQPWNIFHLLITYGQNWAWEELREYKGIALSCRTNTFIGLLSSDEESN